MEAISPPKCLRSPLSRWFRMAKAETSTSSKAANTFSSLLSGTLFGVALDVARRVEEADSSSDCRKRSFHVSLRSLSVSRTDLAAVFAASLTSPASCPDTERTSRTRMRGERVGEAMFRRTLSMSKRLLTEPIRFRCCHVLLFRRRMQTQVRRIHRHGSRRPCRSE